MLVLVLLMAFTSPTWAQTGGIAGVVTDSLTEEALVGANVIVQETQQGSATNAEGNFTISGVEPGTYTVVATLVGYSQATEEVEVSAGEVTQVDFQLTEATVALDEVVAVGYGEQTRQDVTGSVQGVSSEDFEGLPVNSATEALQGQVAGLNITDATGVPGGGPDIQLRGLGNIGAGGQPLYVVDGFALPHPGRNESLSRNPLADIPAEDIESISVLKDASATAIYGSRGSNGVILIETAQGQSGSFDANLSVSSGVHQFMDRMHIIHGGPASGKQFVDFQNFIWQDRVERGAASEIPEPYRNPEQYDGPSVDWFDQITRTAQRHKVQGSVRGGFESVRSYFSMGITRDEGTMINHDYSRLSARANLDADLTDRLSAGLKLAPTYSIRNLNWEGGTARDGAGGAPWMMSPIEPVRTEDGSLNRHVGEESPGVWSHPNPIMWLQEEVNDHNEFSGLGSAFAEYEFGEGLTARTEGNVEYRTGEVQYFNPSVLGGTNSPPPSTPTGSFSTDTRLNWLSETTLSLDRELGPGSISATTGFTAQGEEVRGSGFSGEFPDDAIQTLNVAENIDGWTDEQGWSLLSGLMRANYNLLDRYVFTGTFRADGSSRFGGNNRWGYFPSGAVAWNIHNESFMEELSSGPIPQLKLRLSYGLTGNNQIGNYSHLGVVSATDYVLGGGTAAGRVLSTMENAALGWERTEEFNAGIDATLYDHALDLTLEVYQRSTTELLINRELPWISGFSSVTENRGEVRNRGLEVTLTSFNVREEDYSWTTNFNISMNRNEVTSLPDGEDVIYSEFTNSTHILREGLPAATWVGYRVDGVYTPNMIDDPDVTKYDDAIAGNIAFRELNGDDEFTPDVMEKNGGDFTVLGNAYPDFTFSLGNTINIGNLTLRANVTGEFGGDNHRAEFFRTSRNIDGLFITDSGYVENFWRSVEEPGDGMTPSPLGPAFGRQQYRDANHSDVPSSSSNIWLKSATVRYNVGDMIGLSSASVYVTGNNLFILTPYPGNPETTSMYSDLGPGLDIGNYPVPRSFTFGVDLTL